MSCENKIETTQMRSNANPTLTQMRESGELDDDSSSANSTSTSSDKGLTNVQSGAIGAMVSLVTVLVVMFAFQLFGFLTVGKRQIRAARQGDDHNAVSLTGRG
jgi:hypothetical protein